MIYIVEDDASIRDIEVYALQSTGFEARGFEDGTSFWDALQGAALPELVQPGDCVLVKASHSMAFERIVQALTQN